ncbi:MAG: thioredoxin, partial [Alphaproteobacteria bacterium]|nr:thioredoxin [Alphaproteobacteria bacterium]
MQFETANTAQAGNIVYDTSTATFAKDVIEASKTALVLVDFWADWCGPCKQLTPVIENVVRSYGGKVRLAKLNVDQHPAISGQLRIQSLPTVYAFIDGRPVDGFAGVQPESAIRELIDRHLGAAAEADLATAIEEGRNAFEAGDLQGAAEIYAMILQSDPQHPAALAGLAHCYLKSGDTERARQTIALVPPDKQNDPAVSSFRAALDLADRAANAVDTSALEAKLENDPSDHAARLELAVAKAGNGDKERAVDELIELFRRDRNWNDEAARKQLLQFFEAWG